MKTQPPPAWLPQLQSALAEDPSVCLAYLFGSYAKQRQMPESDVDIGVFLYEPYTEDDENRIWSMIEDIVAKPVDLVIINNAPPLIAAAAMEGQALVVKNTYVEIQTWLRVSGEAMDYTEFINEFWLERAKAQKGEGK
ncbi:MAG TPA: nucleotidyltransferase domain-containing protein [Firmicutes bacterium]|nr:nucleotidyltransferase domain-containing protein [Bacillota bacterium]